MLGLIITRNGRQLPNITKASTSNILNKNFNPLSIRTDNMRLSTVIVSIVNKENDLAQDTKQKGKRKINIKRIRGECSVCYDKRYLKTFRCSHTICLICVDELRNVFCPVCRASIQDQLNDVQLEMIRFKQNIDIKDIQRQTAEEDEIMARNMASNMASNMTRNMASNMPGPS